jgi:hypothetical protein
MSGRQIEQMSDEPLKVEAPVEPAPESDSAKKVHQRNLQ